MYAVIKTGGKQYRVSEGQLLRVEKLARQARATRSRSARCSWSAATRRRSGSPLVQGAAVAAEITAQDRGKKLVVFKFRRRKNYRRKNGHRQPYTELKITGITG